MSNEIFLRKSKRNINRLIFHHFGASIPADMTAAKIRYMHINGRKWDDIGYQGVIMPDGLFCNGRDVDVAGAHTWSFNNQSIGIMFLAASDVGGLTRPTDAQLATARKIINEQKSYYGNDLSVVGHRDLRPTHCPGFDVSHWYKTNEIRK